MKLKQTIARFLHGIANKIDPQSKFSECSPNLPIFTGVRFEERIAHIDTIRADYRIPDYVPKHYVEREICDGIAKELLTNKFVKIEEERDLYHDFSKPHIRYKASLKVVRPL